MVEGPIHRGHQKPRADPGGRGHTGRQTAQRQTVIPSRRNRHHVAQPAGHIRLAVIVVSPTPPPGPRPSAPDCDHLPPQSPPRCSTRWAHSSGRTVGAPRHHPALGRQRQTVSISRRNRHHVAQPAGHIRLAVTVVSPTPPPGPRPSAPDCDTLPPQSPPRCSTRWAHSSGRTRCQPHATTRPSAVSARL